MVKRRLATISTEEVPTVPRRTPTPRASLETLFRPKSVAVVGASPTHMFARQSLENFSIMGYPGELGAVNPKYDEILGYPCAPNLSSLPFVPEAVLVGVNRNLVVPVVEEAAELGVKAVVVFAIGFAEIGDEGLARQARMVDVARDAGMALIGPNCQGVINFVDRTPMYMGYTHQYEPGRVALISQSGSVTTAVANNKRGVRWSNVLSVGNEAVTDGADLLGYFVDDPHTDVICMFIETVRDPERFFAECDRARAAGKPVIALKSGRTEAAAAAATAHSGALAAPDRLVDALLARHGVLRTESIEELLETAIALQSKRLPKGRRVAAMTASGGQIELILDQTGPLGFEHPTFEGDIAARLRSQLPDFLDVKNPLDWWGVDDMYQGYRDLLETIVSDPEIDIVVSATDFSYHPTGQERDSSQLTSAIELAQDTDKVIVVLDTVDGSVPKEIAEDALAQGVLALSGVPVGLRALRHLADFAEQPPAEAEPADIDGQHVETFLSQHPHAVAGLPALELLNAAHVAVPATRLAANEDEAAAVAADIGFPVALKSGDPLLLHKTESGALLLGLRDEEAVRAGARQILAAGAESVLVQQQLVGGVELILGLDTHPELGTFVLVGLGGIWTEVMNDVAIRPVGLREGEAEQMLRSLRGFGLLDGARGTAPVDIAAVVRAIESVDSIGRSFGHRIRSLDINPLIVSAEGAVAVDALVVPLEAS